MKTSRTNTPENAGVERFGDEFIINTFQTGNQLEPIVRPLTGGGYVVAWWSNTNNPDTLRAQVLDENGAKVGGEIIVEDDFRWFQFDVQALSSGGFAVVWTPEPSSGSSDGIHAALYSASGAPLGPELIVSTANAGFQNDPEIAELANGNFLVTWNDGSMGVGGATGDTSGTAIKGQRFTGDGTPIGVEFLVNTTTLNNQ